MDRAIHHEPFHKDRTFNNFLTLAFQLFEIKSKSSIHILKHFLVFSHVGFMKVSFERKNGEGFVSNIDGKDVIRIDDHYTNKPNLLSPTDYLLFAFGGCSGSDILNILEKMRQMPERYECELTGERREEFPKIFKFVNAHYKVWGNTKPENLKKAINLSLSKYCHVGITLIRAGVDVTYTYSINGKTIESDLHPDLPPALS